MIRPALPSDKDQILALYRAVASVPDGLARTPDEVTEAYVDGFMGAAARDGIELVYEQDGVILGDIHASRVGIASLVHLLTELTIAVSPICQSKGVGRQLFQGLINDVMANKPYIKRIELFVRPDNVRARALYESLGFIAEGVLRSRINNSKGETGSDIIMGWLRPADD
jgi:ribosomal protein S18 acetylase RimI-like enzyme